MISFRYPITLKGIPTYDSIHIKALVTTIPGKLCHAQYAVPSAVYIFIFIVCTEDGLENQWWDNCINLTSSYIVYTNRITKARKTT